MRKLGTRDEGQGTRDKEMRKVTKILILILLSLFLSVLSFAQNKIAVINGYDFYDENRASNY